MNLKKIQLFGLILLAVAGVAVAGVFFYNSKDRQIPVVFSEREMLGNIWYDYKKSYIEPGSNRTLDKQRGSITTSEGQSYTMMRAAWMDDKETFDQAWQWTQDNLQHNGRGRTGDNLFSWLYGERSDGTYGVITEQGGNHTATDGDSDIAVALLMAHGRWSRDADLTDAKAIISDMWEYEVVSVKGKPVLASNNIERDNKESIIVNPSYFSPYAYRLFAKVDPTHDWEGVANSSYDILRASTEVSIDGKTGVLPPNWLVMDRSDGSITASENKDLNFDYGYDAMRIPWRIALDYKWFATKDASSYLDSLGFLGSQWESKGSLSSVYTHSGDVVAKEESPAMYGSSIGYFLVSKPDSVEAFYRQKLESLYSPDTDGWKTTLGYYDDNWAWFGMALVADQLPELTRP